MKLINYLKGKRIPLRKATLCFLLRENNILLARKKRGFAKEKINGVGGKVNNGESIKSAAIRETFEEIGVKVKSLKQTAILNFYFTHNYDWNQQVIVYEVRKWEGDPKESEEVDPFWCSLKKIPYEKMWWDDRLWLPKILDGKRVKASFLFNEKQVVLDHEIKEY